MKKLILSLTLILSILALADENSTYSRSKNIEKNENGFVTSSSESFSYSYSYSGSGKETKKVVSNDKDIREVLEIYKKFYDYKISKNIKGLEQILDKDFILSDTAGEKKSKTEWFSQIENEEIKYYSAEEEDVKVSLSGDMGELISKNKVDVKVHNSREILNLQLTMNIEKINGKWLIKNIVESVYSK